ncbi:MAG: hypothetical protein AAF740_06895 [Bacteroidota bacterium]
MDTFQRKKGDDKDKWRYIFVIIICIMLLVSSVIFREYASEGTYWLDIIPLYVAFDALRRLLWIQQANKIDKGKSVIINRQNRKVTFIVGSQKHQFNYDDIATLHVYRLMYLPTVIVKSLGEGILIIKTKDKQCFTFSSKLLGIYEFDDETIEDKQVAKKLIFPPKVAH